MEDNNEQNIADQVISNELKFKAKLAIGEDAYTSLKTLRITKEVWDVLGAATTGAAVAGSSTVATTFFASNSLFAALGLAATPIGWIVAAGLASGAIWYGGVKFFQKEGADRVDVIPKFLNTGIDLLANSLFCLITPVALKVAEADGVIDKYELDVIERYFVDQWGYDRNYVTYQLTYCIENKSEQQVKVLAEALADYKRKNPDCNYEKISNDVKNFLLDIAQADGEYSEQEKNVLEIVNMVLDNYSKPSFAFREFFKKNKT